MATITLNRALTLGPLLQMFRQMAGIDQTEMGRLIGASRPTISAWERDEREPSFSQVVAWAKITGQPLDTLVEAANAKAAETTDQKVGGSSPSRRTLLLRQSIDALALWCRGIRRSRAQRATDAEFWSIVAGIEAVRS